MPNAGVEVNVVEVVAYLVWGAALVLLLLEIVMRRCGRSGAGWGVVGLLLLAGAIASASLSAIALRLQGTSPDALLASRLDVIVLVASIGFGGLGANLLAYGLTSIKPKRRSP